MNLLDPTLLVLGVVVTAIMFAVVAFFARATPQRMLGALVGAIPIVPMVMLYERRKPMNVIIILICAVIALILLGYLGLKIRPNPFPPFPQRTPALNTVPLPEGLPAPVRRFFRQIYGDYVPVIESAVIVGMEFHQW